MNNSNQSRSLFWPIFLIGIGVIWLLGNLGFIAAANLGNILRLWPLALVVIGLNLVIGRTSAVASAVIGLLAVGIIIAALVAAPALGMNNPTQPEIHTYTETVNGADQADIYLDLSSYSTSIDTVRNKDNLFEGEIGAYGTVNYKVSGTNTRSISLSHTSSPDMWFNIPFNSVPLRWDIGLNPQVPTSLKVDAGSGSTQMDLGDLQLNDLRLDIGSGSMKLTLPTSIENYTARIDGGSGSLDLRISGQENLTIELDMGSGSTDIDLPANVAIRIEVDDDGSGSLSLPKNTSKVSYGNDDDEGVWESEDYDSADTRILVRIVGAGSGSINIR
jgi:hypothetical protein